MCNAYSLLMCMKRKCWIFGAVFGMVFFFADVFRAPIFSIEAGGDRLVAVPLYARQEFSIQFIHSVQKTPVAEYLEAVPAGKEQGIILHSTTYQSFGVGLPFLEEEGELRKDGDFYILDHMERHFGSISLRVGVGTKLRILIGEKEVELYRSYPAGTKVDIGFSVFGRRIGG